MIFDTGHSEYDAMSTENRKKFHYLLLCRFQKSKQKVPHYRHYSVMKIKKEVYLEILKIGVIRKNFKILF